MRVSADDGHHRLDKDILRIGGEAHASSGALAAKLGDAIRRCCRNILGQAAEYRLPCGIVEVVKFKRGVPYAVEAYIRLGKRGL